jgi:hypothetical protein
MQKVRLPKFPEDLLKEYQSPRYDRLAIGLTETPVLPPPFQLTVPMKYCWCCARGWRAPSHDSGAAQLVPRPIGRTQIFTHLLYQYQVNYSLDKLTGQLPTAVPPLCHCASHAPLFFDSLSTDIGLLSAGRLATGAQSNHNQP